MRNVTLEQLFVHPITQKYVGRSGIAHAISVAENAFHIAVEKDVEPDLATKAGLLHDIGHYQWYSKNGEWDFQTYQQNDIHAIKGAARAHKLLVRCGEDLKNAKKIALAILLHTDSYLPDGQLQLSPLQQVVAEADEIDELPGGAHHYNEIEYLDALNRIRLLDQRITDFHNTINIAHTARLG